MVGHQTALWSGVDSEPTYVYTESMRPFSINDFGASIVAPYPMTASPNGEVFVAYVSMEEYLITSYNSSGEVLWTVERPYEKIEKTEEEIDLEESMVQRRMQQSAHQMNYTADPYHFSVISLSLGPDGKLWAERPGNAGAFFDVFEPLNGEYLFSVSTATQYERLEVTQGGIFAIPEGEIQVLLQLELR